MNIRFCLEACLSCRNQHVWFQLGSQGCVSAFCPAGSLKHICLSMPLSPPLVPDSGFVAGLFSSTLCCIPTVCTVILSSLPLFCSQMAGLLHANEPQTFGRIHTTDMKEIQPHVRSASWQGELGSRQTLIISCLLTHCPIL